MNYVNSIPLDSTFDRLESNVRSYCRSFPTVFTKALNARLFDAQGRSYIDLLSGAGVLNYGHNNPAILEPVINYLQSGGVLHSLDLHTEAKENFLLAIEKYILRPRGLEFRIQFPGPTGTNAIEAALKLARKVTGRSNIVAFTNGFHGMSLGALAATANPFKRAGAGTSLGNVTFLPFDGFLGPDNNTMEIIEPMLMRVGSGVDAPAAILVETVQGEGGLNVASAAWLQKLAALAKRVGALFIVDDIQAGIGRTGTFFSFEPFDIKPDIVVLSKALSGFGSPLSLVLMHRSLDVWEPGEHNGTFRGNNLAFVGATAALETFWNDNRFTNEVERKSKLVAAAFQEIIKELPPHSAQLRGRGLFCGIAFSEKTIAERISRLMFAKGIIIETCGMSGEVLKFLPALTIPDTDLDEALNTLKDTIRGISELH